MKWFGALDMYRKIPSDLMEGTRRGSIFSYLAVLVMIILFVLETRAYYSTQIKTDLALDNNKDERIRINFNITMMDLKCDYAVIDVVSVLGTQQNVTSHVSKWHVDAAGVRQRYQGRNRMQHDIELSDPRVTKSIESLHANGMDAMALDPQTFAYALREKEYLFVDFYASWCSHCQKLAPTWESLAEAMTIVAEDLIEARIAEHEEEDENGEIINRHHFTKEELEHAKMVELPVMVAKIDCVQHDAFCREHGIMAYPTLRLFVDGERWKQGDYRGDRTVVKMADYLRQVEDVHKTETESKKAKKMEFAHEVARDMVGENDHDDDDEQGAGAAGKSAEQNEWADRVRRRREMLHNSWVDEDHPGCQLSGHLLLDRAPGNFHIQARSAHHDLVPHMTNVSHVVHHLTVGEPVVERMIQRKTVHAPDDVKNKIAPMDNNVYVTYELHESYHHYLKVITTNVEGLVVGKRKLLAYQVLQSSQLAYYRNDVIPEAKFIMDLSPIAVSYRTTSRHWYDYLTSLMAIIGGTFTIIGMLESSIHAATTRKKSY